MISFPNCKINLGLNILAKREDGFHDLETIFFPVSFTDILEIIPAKAFSFQTSGLECTSDNLCIRAYELLKQDFPLLPAVAMHLHKAIPLGSGLGGGSADAAFTLKLLNDKFLLSLSDDQFLQYAARLGSDCPFFIYNKPCLATGRGEKLNPVDLPLKGCKLVLINPGITVSTSWAFSQIIPSSPASHIENIIKMPIENWKEYLFNDFEGPVFSKYPEIGEIKAFLYDSGAAYASLSGSGSTVFGIFKSDMPLPGIENYFHKIIEPA